MPDTNQIGEITLLHGDARAIGPEGSRPLEQGSEVYQGETIETARGAALEITFADGMKLSQGAGSRVELDTYVYDPENNTGEILFNMVEGTFRSVTGKVVDMNPDGFNLKSPLATIGIRGTTTGHSIPGEGGGEEEHLVITYDGKPVIVASPLGGPPQVLTTSGLKVLASTEGISDFYRASPEEIARFEQLSTESLREGVPDIQDDENEDDTGDGNNENTDAQGDGDAPVAVVSVMNQEGQVLGFVEGEIVAQTPQPDQQDPQNDPIDEIIGGGEGSGGDGGGGQGDDDDDTTDDDADTGGETQTVLDLSDYWQGMLTIDMGTNEYYPTEMANNTTSFPSTVTTVIGSETQANTIYGDTEANDITGGQSDDVIESGDGNDIVRMGAYLDPNDAVDGGDGTDTLEFTYAAGAGEFQMDGVKDFEVVDLSNSVANEEVRLTLKDSIMDANTDTMTLDVTDLLSTAQLNFNASSELEGNFIVVGTANDDSLVGGHGNDVLTGGDGADVINGKEGNDLIDGGEGADMLYGFDGDDTLTYAGSSEGVTVDLADTLAGGTVKDEIDGFENVIGSSFDDSLKGTTDNNIISGLCGDDTLRGYKGVDTISTGSGADDVYYGTYLEVTNGGATDVVTDFSHASDSFVFDATEFGGVQAGTLDANNFFTSLNDVAGSGITDAVFIWESNTLYVDLDGAGTGQTEQTIASVTMEDGDLDHTDITFV